MKKNRIRAAALALVICLLGCCAAESGITKGTWYSAGIAALEEMTAESLSETFFTSAEISGILLSPVSLPGSGLKLEKTGMSCTSIVTARL